jgi:hypothetical protein
LSNIAITPLPLHAETATEWKALFHSVPFYETDCSDADNVCNGLGLSGPACPVRNYYGVLCRMATMLLIQKIL